MRFTRYKLCRLRETRATIFFTSIPGAMEQAEFEFKVLPADWHR